MTRHPRLARAGLLLLLLAPRDSAAQEGAAAALGLDSLLNVPISASGTYQQTARRGASSVTIITAEDDPAPRLPDAAGRSGRRPRLLPELRPELLVSRRPGLQPAERLQQPHPAAGGRQRRSTRASSAARRSGRLELPMRPAVARADRDRPRPGLGALRHRRHLRGGQPGHPARRRRLRRRRAARCAAAATARAAARSSIAAPAAVGARPRPSAAPGTAADGRDLFYPEYDSPETQRRRRPRHGLGDGCWACSKRRSGRRLHPHTGGTAARTKAIPTGAYETRPGRRSQPDPRRLTVSSSSSSSAPWTSRARSAARAYLNVYRYDGVYLYDG